MFCDEIMALFEKHKVLTNQDIRNNLKMHQKQDTIINTEIKRLCDKDMIRRVGRGVYTIVWNTRWGKVIPTEVEIINILYMKNGEGYISGPAYYNAIGISTLIPNCKEITTNKYNCILDNLVNTDIVRPRKTITNENKLYLQLLDGICCLSENHCDALAPLAMFAKQLRELELDEMSLRLMAKELYPQFVLDMVLDMEEI